MGTDCEGSQTEAKQGVRSNAQIGSRGGAQTAGGCRSPAGERPMDSQNARRVLRRRCFRPGYRDAQQEGAFLCQDSKTSIGTIVCFSYATARLTMADGSCHSVIALWND